MQIEFEYGRLVVSREAAVEVDGEFISVFQQNTIAVRVEWETGIEQVVVFPRNWLATHSPEDREAVLVGAMYGAGGGIATGNALVAVR